jgi:hypothetical protein
MKDEIRPTLAEVARQTYWEPGLEIDSEVVDKALLEAGISPSDHKERLRFCSLVEDAYYQSQQDELALLGDYADEARSELGEDASVEDVISLAYQLREEDEHGVR